VNAGLLYRNLRRHGAYTPHAGWPRLMLQILVGVAVMVAAVFWATPPADDWSAMAASDRGGRLALGVVVGISAYLVALRLAGMRLSMLWAPATQSGRAP
jgi:putative peptidoglycan lipid II flippase